MRSKRLFVIVTQKLPDPIETRMMELFACRLNLSDKAFDKSELRAAVGQADVLVPTVTDRIDAEMLAAAGPALKLIASFGTGVDHVDLAAAQRRGIIVTNTPGVLTEDTADMTMALILAVSRRPAPEEVENALEATYWESLDQMLAHMDIVSVNCPHTPATYHLLSARRLRLLQPRAILVNTARGEVVDEEELTHLLETRAIAGAGLDVFEHEPAIDPRLRALDNVVLLPHMGSSTIEGRIAMGERVIINIKTFADGHRPPDRVLDSML